MKKSPLFLVVGSLVGLMNVSMSFAQVSVGNSTSLKEGGEAHNGPDTSGKSIPFKSDRAIKLKDLNEVIKSCSKDLINQISNKAFNEDSFDFKGSINWASSGDKITLSEANYETNMKNYKFTMYRTYAWGGDNYNIIIRNNEAYESLLETNINLPRFFIDNTFNETIVDDFGRPNSPELISVKGLSIEYPQTSIGCPNKTSAGIEYCDVPDFEQLKNVNTGLPTSFKVNVRAYFNCLISGVQK